MSSFEQFFGGGGVKSIQTGHLSGSGNMQSGSGEFTKYWDVTISSVDPAKSIVLIVGGAVDNSGSTTTAVKKSAQANEVYEVWGKVTSATNIRIGNSVFDLGPVNAVWTVVEFN